MALSEEDLCELSKEDLAKIIARLKGEIPTQVELPDNSFSVDPLASQLLWDVPVIPNIYRTVFYIIMWSDVLSKFKALEITCNYMNNVATDSIRNVSGSLDVSLNWDRVVNKLELNMQNNENAQVQVRIQRLDYVNV